MDTITLEQAQATLMSREALKKSKEGDRDPSGLALVTEVRRRKSTSMRLSNNVQCFQCKGYGHIKRDYPTKWDISNENKEGVAENLTLSNKSIVKVMGLGVVKIKMFNGIMCSLGGVAYVSEMRKNLVSLSLLNSKRHGYSTCDGVASKGWEQCTGDGSYQSEISFAEEVMKGSHGVDDGERTKNLISSELEGSSRSMIWKVLFLESCSRCWKVGGVRKLQSGATGGKGLKSLNSSQRATASRCLFAHFYVVLVNNERIISFQSLGIVYGDLGTLPLYVLPSTFNDGIKHSDDVLGVYSLIFYTITLLPLVKYILIVFRATDNGDGTYIPEFCIHKKIEGHLLCTRSYDDLRKASARKSKLEKSQYAKYFLLLSTMIGTSMLIGDGILTPSISVLSAVGGIKQATPAMTQDMVVWISAAILVFLFMIQRFGTDKVDYSFAPIMCVWFMLIGRIGVYNFIKFDPLIVKAINPQYIIAYFRRNKKAAWISLGDIILCIIGAEALFADVGHFTVLSVQITRCTIVYPTILLAYTGQASFLRKHQHCGADAFYKSVPGPLYWPMFVVAVLAAIIGTKYQGQVYIPEINYLLMLACVGITLGFRTTDKIGNAYGVAVVSVMVLASSLLVLIMIIIRKPNILFIISYVLVIGLLELTYLSSVLYKFESGGYLPLAVAAVLVTVMIVWNSVHRKRYYYELQHKISVAKLPMITMDTNLSRIPGLALFYSKVVQGIPPIFKHYVSNIPALHSVLVFVSIKSMLISKVRPEERFLFRRLEPKELRIFRCVVRYDYKDVQDKQKPIENQLDGELQSELSGKKEEHENLAASDQDKLREAVEGEIEVVNRASQAGVFHLIGENGVSASKGAGIAKKILINYAYNFLKKYLTQSDKVLQIPRERMLKIGMTYEL
ncbi:Potassium transporter, putative [Theobroma cacao]|uniref:Potassium transporter, putative n=1 Tax=Theobroma cacao TaxID=3641 RepID=A0A061DQ23_THECC|nr:Potassium transporter, putative [Theobroma cacao]